MKTSESIIKIAPAFLKAQKNIESVIKDSSNPFFKSKYADLTAVIDACKDHLNKEGIAILQPVDGMNVETILIHESGEWFSSITPVVAKEQNNPQALGSAITYAKRYGLQSMVLLPAEDDDGNAASNTESKSDHKPQNPPANTYVCEECGTTIPSHRVDASMAKFGRSICYACETKGATV